jgi:hypothetical protein
MPKKRGSLHNRIAARGEQYNEPAAPSFNLDFGSELLRVKGFVTVLMIFKSLIHRKAGHSNVKTRFRRLSLWIEAQDRGVFGDSSIQ